MKLPAFVPIIIVGALGFDELMCGTIDASQTIKPLRLCTCSSGFVAASD